MADQQQGMSSPNQAGGGGATANTTITDKLDSRDAKLVTWVSERVKVWEQYRDQNFKELWEQSYRFWKGVHNEKDKTRKSERSTLISPALAQAIESNVAELEEATFGRKIWFDVSDDIQDEDQRDNSERLRDLLLERFEMDGIPSAVSEVYLNSAIYGTGIAKIIPESYEEKTIQTKEENGQIVDGVVIEDRFRVKLEAIPPDEFVIDSSVTRSGRDGIEQALGMAHCMVKPRHVILSKMAKGLYKESHITDNQDILDVSGKGEHASRDPKGKVKVVEYYGLVPRQYMGGGEFSEGETVDEDELVEAIVTIANEETLLRADENPYIMQDRPIIAYQHDTVPNRFWGRGIGEKGNNPQRALNAILRGQMDGLSLTVHPMMAGDATRLPRGFNLTVRPGKNILTNGPPGEVLQPLNFGQIDPATYTSASDLERQIQMGTGAMDSSTPLKTNRRNETASGMSMMLQGSVKRSKRTLQNIGRSFLEPLVRKAAWRYMQFEPDRFVPSDFKFVVRTTLGIMAREVEVQQLINLLQIVPPDTPAFPAILKGILDNSSLDNKTEIIAAIAQMFQPDPQAQQAQQQAAQDQSQLNQAKARESSARAMDSEARAGKTIAEVMEMGEQSGNNNNKGA